MRVARRFFPLERALQSFQPEQLWVNPDCGLKTRSWTEVSSALVNMGEAARVVRDRARGGVVKSANATNGSRTGTAA